MDDPTKALELVRDFEPRVVACEQVAGGFKAQMDDLQMSVSECCEEVLAQNENLANQRASQHSSAPFAIAQAVERRVAAMEQDMAGLRQRALAAHPAHVDTRLRALEEFQTNSTNEVQTVVNLCQTLHQQMSGGTVGSAAGAAGGGVG